MIDTTATAVRRRRARNAAELRVMLADLKFALDHLAHVERCMDKSPQIDGLWGFRWWLRERECKVCRRRIPVQALKYCSETCRKRMAGEHQE